MYSLFHGVLRGSIEVIPQFGSKLSPLKEAGRVGYQAYVSSLGRRRSGQPRDISNDA